MQATANSNIKRRINLTKTIKNIIAELPLFWDPNKDNNKWPATILAANRIANVPGRIILLTVSIITITGNRGAGVPKGTKCAIKWLNWKITDQTMPPIHMGRDKVRVKIRCLELVKM